MQDAVGVWLYCQNTDDLVRFGLELLVALPAPAKTTSSSSRYCRRRAGSLHPNLTDMNNLSKRIQWYALAITVFLADQTAKSYIDATTPLGWSHEVTSFFNLVHALNPGAAFSFLADAGGWQRWFFLAIALAVSVWLVRQLYSRLRKLESLSYCLILGGALGNAFDRAMRGQVIDYLDFHLRGRHWPAFNIADMAIVGGAIVLVLASLMSGDCPNAAKEPR